MPSPAQILQTLGELAQRWWPVAMLWHAYVVVLGAAVIAGWRPRRRLAAALILLPVASVVAMALLTGNLFTGIVLGGCLGAASAIVAHMPRTEVQLGAPWKVFAGAGVLLFGLTYPHFLGHAAPVRYLYAAPLGIVPCPSLAAAIGASLVFNVLGSRGWSLLLVAAGGFYGVFGALRLGVGLDWLLVAGALLLLASSFRTRRLSGQVTSSFGTGRAA